MQATASVQLHLTDFLDKFKDLAARYDHTTQHSLELEQLIDQYSSYITSESNRDIWGQLEQQGSEAFDSLVEELRQQSARCVAIMEKYRALKLLGGQVELGDYFQNIEACIEHEFGSFQVTPDSNVLLVGSGSFPMTPLLIAKRTGAEVIGIDIDEEAIDLGRQVVDRLGSELNIRLERMYIEQLECIQDVTHIIFSSTVSIKYELLDQLHSLTNERVVVAMRYGDQLKSLFNYPMREVDGGKWKLVNQILRPDQIFDIALYTKA
ncbi:methyltransferase domain-containing protein [Paenibacillus tarimensis]|uniref:methyltransferase domain-containing protein n=1 Tax=Paenibacillus tarimensis TaxID=416012 RepID=UPI001F21D6F8|nr:methyltransferase domain-containing protein [Paenibacillus tarimensis]MCF2945505.1 methyltransferase domain-containing protein [Paenibacillus tarimensis]